MVIHFFTQIFLDGTDYMYDYNNLLWVFPTEPLMTNYHEFVYSLSDADHKLADGTFEELRLICYFATNLMFVHFYF